MKCLGAAAVCIAVLYGVDVFWFDGWYFASTDRMLSEFYRQWL
jgi:hypothetical protein